MGILSMKTAILVFISLAFGGLFLGLGLNYKISDEDGKDEVSKPEEIIVLNSSNLVNSTISSDLLSRSVSLNDTIFSTFEAFSFLECIDSNYISDEVGSYCLPEKLLMIRQMTDEEIYDTFYSLNFSDVKPNRFNISYMSIEHLDSFGYSLNHSIHALNYTGFYSYWLVNNLKKFLTYEDKERDILDEIYRMRDNPRDRLEISEDNYDIVVAMSQPLFWSLLINLNLTDYEQQENMTDSLEYYGITLSSEIDYGFMSKLNNDTKLREQTLTRIMDIDKILEESVKNGGSGLNSSFSSYSGTKYPKYNNLINNYYLSKYVKSTNVTSNRMRNIGAKSYSTILRFISNYFTVRRFNFPIGSFKTNPLFKQNLTFISESVGDQIIRTDYCENMIEYFDLITVFGIIYELSRIELFGRNDIESVMSTIIENNRLKSLNSRDLNLGTSLILISKLHPKYAEYKRLVSSNLEYNVEDLLGKKLGFKYLLNSIEKTGFSDFKGIVYKISGLEGVKVFYDTLNDVRNGTIKFTGC